jgi:hypothetical protein
MPNGLIPELVTTEFVDSLFVLISLLAILSRIDALIFDVFVDNLDTY